MSLSLQVYVLCLTLHFPKDYETEFYEPQQYHFTTDNYNRGLSAKLMINSINEIYTQQHDKQYEFTQIWPTPCNPDLIPRRACRAMRCVRLAHARWKKSKKATKTPRVGTSCHGSGNSSVARCSAASRKTVRFLNHQAIHYRSL